MTEWQTLYNNTKVNLGSGFDYLMTFFRKGLIQIELMREYNWEKREYEKACGMNIGTLTPEIIADETDDFKEMIQGDYTHNQEFSSYEEALAYAKKYMETY